MGTAVAHLVPASNDEWIAYLQTRSLELRDELVLRHMPLVKRVAAHYAEIESKKIRSLTKSQIGTGDR